jgi:hypothetical protein
MTTRIPDDYLDLFTGSAFGHLATVMADGSPQVTPVFRIRPGRVVVAEFG